MLRSLSSFIAGLLLLLACSGCYVGAGTKNAAAASTLGPQAFVEDQLLSGSPWNENERVAGGGMIYVASFNEESSSQLSVPRETVQNYCEAKGGKLVFVQSPAVRAGDLSAPARPAVAELMRAADRTQQFGTFLCQRDGAAKWSARIEPRSLSVDGLPKLAVFIACDEQAALGGAPTLQYLGASFTANTVTTEAAALLASQKPLPAGAVVPHIIIDSVPLHGSPHVNEAIVAIHLFRCEGAVLLLGHDVLACSASFTEACASDLASRIAKQSVDDSTRGASACAELIGRPAASTKTTFVPTLVTTEALSSVAQGLRHGLRRDLSAESFLHVDEHNTSAQLEVTIYDMDQSAIGERASSYAVVSSLRCSGTPLYVGHHLGASTAKDLEVQLVDLSDGVKQDAFRAGAYLQGEAARCAP